MPQASRQADSIGKIRKLLEAAVEDKFSRSKTNTLLSSEPET